MRTSAQTCRALLVLCAAMSCWPIAATAQSIALRSRETLDLGDFYIVSRDCKSLLVGTPAIEIIEGPPGVTVTIKDAMVTPYAKNCANPVEGGKVMIAAKDVVKDSQSTLVLRFKYRTRSGEWQSSRRYRLSLFAASKSEESKFDESIVVRSGETIELRSLYWVAKCRSLMIGLPTLEVIEGTPELSFAIKEAEVVPRKYGCVQPVDGGKLMLTAGTIADAKEAKVVYRLRYKLIDGERQVAKTYRFLMYP